VLVISEGCILTPIIYIVMHMIHKTNSAKLYKTWKSYLSNCLASIYLNISNATT